MNSISHDRKKKGPTPCGSLTPSGSFDLVRLILLLVSIYVLICHNTYSLGNQTSTPPPAAAATKNATPVSEDPPPVTWDYVLETTGLANEKTLMQAYEVLHYREYDINDFMRNRHKYGDKILFWLAEKNAISGRLQTAELFMKMLVGENSKFLQEHTYPYAYALLGTIQFSLEKNSEAAVAYKSAIKAGNKNVYGFLAYVSFMSGDQETVKEVMPELMKTKSTDVNALAALVIICQATNDIKLFKELIEGLDDSHLTVDSRLLPSVIYLMKKTGYPNDLLRADKLQKKLDVMLNEQPLNQRLATGAKEGKSIESLRDMLSGTAVWVNPGSVDSSTKPAEANKPTEPKPTNSSTVNPTTEANHPGPAKAR